MARCVEWSARMGLWLIRGLILASTLVVSMAFGAFLMHRQDLPEPVMVTGNLESWHHPMKIVFLESGVIVHRIRYNRPQRHAEFEVQLPFDPSQPDSQVRLAHLCTALEQASYGVSFGLRDWRYHYEMRSQACSRAA